MYKKKYSTKKTDIKDLINKYNRKDDKKSQDQ